LWQGWNWIDPIVSLLIALVIVIGTWSLFRQSLHLLFDGVPDDIDLAAVHQSLQKLEGVMSVHDLHVWAMSTSDNALTAHLVIDGSHRDYDALLNKANDVLHEKFDIQHVSLQFESENYAMHCSIIHSNCTNSKIL
jgi:cobalt-zinc-cadmium efflux system protein